MNNTVSAGLLATILALQLGVPAREQLRRPAPGTARIAGRVLTTDKTPQPVRLAIVSLYSSGDTLGRHTVTDDEGKFAFEALPAGPYNIWASRPSFVSIPLGASKPGRAGSPLAVEAGQQLDDVCILLARGAAVSGQVRDEQGNPIPNLDVRVEQRDRPGQSAFFGKTDDQGVYRVFGLPAGTYVVSARPRSMETNERQFLSDAQVDEALKALAQRRASRSVFSVQIKSAGGTTSRGTSAADFVPVYYPSSFLSDEAASVELVEGEDRHGIDILIRLMSTSVVAGQILGPGSVDYKNVELTLTKAGSKSFVDALRTVLRPDGGFRFPSVQPGKYLMAARMLSGARISSLAFAPSGQPCLVATEEILVSGIDRLGLALALRPCLRIEGRVAFSDTARSPKPSAVTAFRVVLESDPAGDSASYVPLRLPAVVDKNGTFVLGEVGDVLPGSYRLTVLLPERDTAIGWRVESMIVDGHEVLDLPIEVGASSSHVMQAVITFGDEPSSLTGVLQSTVGGSAQAYTVVAFATNPAYWRTPFRRVQGSRPGSNGYFTFPDLPPDEYYLVALTDLAPNNWRDSEFLSEIAKTAIRVTVRPHERRVQDLRIGR